MGLAAEHGFLCPQLHAVSPRKVSSSWVALILDRGCGRCSIIGGTVDLLYWPPTTATNSTIGMQSITSAAGAAEIVTTIGDAVTTLTSPTLYVSYRSLYAADACSNQIGKTVYDTIIAIPNGSTLQSIWAMIGAPNGYESTADHTSTTSFNVSDLYRSPVPMSIYSSQPWCAQWAYQNLWPFNSSWWECPSDQPYRPIIRVPEDLLKSIDPLWEDCIQDFGGVYDPPVALTPADSVAKPTLPNVIKSLTTPAMHRPTPVPVAQTSAESVAVAEATTAIATASVVAIAQETNSSAEPANSESTNSSADDAKVPASPKTATDAIPNAVDVLESALHAEPKYASQPTSNTVLISSHGSLDSLDNTLGSIIGADGTAQMADGDPDAVDAVPAPFFPDGVPKVIVGAKTYIAVLSAGNAAALAYAVDPAADSVNIGGQTVPVTRTDDVIVIGEGKSATTFELAGHAVSTVADEAMITIGALAFTRVGDSNVFADGVVTFSLPQGVATTALSIAQNGHDVVVGSGAGASTLTLPSEHNAAHDDEVQVTVGDQTLTRLVAATNVFENKQTTFTLLPGFPETFVGSIVQLASNGRDLVVGTGPAATTIVLPSTQKPERSVSFTVSGREHILAQVPGDSARFVLDGSKTVTWIREPATLKIDGGFVTLVSSELLVGDKTFPWSTGTSAARTSATKGATGSDRSSQTESSVRAVHESSVKAAVPTSQGTSWRSSLLLWMLLPFTMIMCEAMQ